MNPQTILGTAGGALQGASSGLGGVANAAAYSNPYSAAAMAAGQALSSLFGSPSGPQMASNAPWDAFTVDNSGWSVNFGSGSASAQPNPVSTLAQGLANATTAVTSPMSDPLVLLAMVALILVVRK